MANNNSFVYFDDAKVTRRKKLYQVALEDADVTIFLREEVVDSTAEKTNEDKNLIAILLAYIDNVRRSRAKDIGKPPHRIEEDIVADGLKYLLNAISIDELIVQMKSMKWHEIKKILTSENPLEEMDEL